MTNNSQKIEYYNELPDFKVAEPNIGIMAKYIKTPNCFKYN